MVLCWVNIFVVVQLVLGRFKPLSSVPCYPLSHRKGGSSVLSLMAVLLVCKNFQVALMHDIVASIPTLLKFFSVVWAVLLCTVWAVWSMHLTCRNLGFSGCGCLTVQRTIRYIPSPLYCFGAWLGLGGMIAWTCHDCIALIFVSDVTESGYYNAFMIDVCQLRHATVT